MDSLSSSAKFELILRRVRDLPSLPDIVNKIVAVMGHPEVAASEIARLISYDPGLTSKVLRMVNSAAYGFQRQISSVQHAIMLLGFNTVRGVILSATIFKIFENNPAKGLNPNDFWRHSIETAVGSRVLAERLRIRYAEDAFSAGMLHDLGKMLLSSHCSSEYEPVLLSARQKGLPCHGEAFYKLEKAHLGITHTELGYQLGIRWRMPSTILEVIQHHHHPEQAEEAIDLVYVVALANAFSVMNQINFGIFHPDLMPTSLLAYLNCSEEDFSEAEQLFKAVQGELGGVEEFLASLK